MQIRFSRKNCVFLMWLFDIFVIAPLLVVFYYALQTDRENLH